MVGGATFRLAETIIEIQGDHPVVNNINHELAPNKIKKESPNIVFKLSTDPLPNIPSNIVGVGPVFATEERAWLHLDAVGFRLLITFSDDLSQPIDVRVQIQEKNFRNLLPATISRWRTRTFITPLEQMGYAFINGILETMLMLFGKQTAMIHASSIEHSGETILFPSTGGTGKTTLSLLLVSRHGFNYLADDISLVSPEGLAYFYPRYVMMYPYSLQGLSNIESVFLQGRSPSDRFHWNLGKRLFGPKGVRRRVPPHDLYKNNIIDKAPIGRVYFLVRHPANDFSITRVSPSRIAEMSSHILLTEYSYYINYLRYWEATGEAPFKIESLRQKWIGVYKEAFSTVRDISIIRIPIHASPLELEKYFLDVFKNG